MPVERKNILAVRLGALGDVVHVIHAVSGLHRALPDLRLGILTEESLVGMAGVFSCIECAHGTLLRKQKGSVILRSLKRLRRRMRGRYDTIFDFHGMLKSAAAARRSAGNAEVIGFSRPAAGELSWLLTHRQVKVDTEGHLADKAAQALSAVFGVRITPDPLPEMILPPSSVQAARPYVVVPVGTSIQAKIWPMKHMRRLAELISGRMDVYVSGGPGEEQAVRDICASSPAKPVLGLDVPRLAALLAGASAVVGADTGPVQLASAAGAPVVVIFGPTLPERSRPRGPHVSILRSERSCLGCYERICPEAGGGKYALCMEEITPEQTVEAVMNAVEKNV